MPKKSCYQCLKNKCLSEFYENKVSKDGRVTKCKECTRANVHRYRSENIEKVRKYDRERAKDQARRKAASEISKAWSKRDSRIWAAHNAVTRAVRKGDLVRPGGCSICGSGPVFGHHEDYDRKLDVVWYCQPCHKARHKEMAILGIDPLERVYD